MRISASAAIALSAPGRFSTPTGWPSCCESAAPMMRVVGSAEPPGGKPTMKRIGLLGYCAGAGPEASSRAGASRSALNRRLICPPAFCAARPPPRRSRRRRRSESWRCAPASSLLPQARLADDERVMRQVFAAVALEVQGVGGLDALLLGERLLRQALEVAHHIGGQRHAPPRSPAGQRVGGGGAHAGVVRGAGPGRAAARGGGGRG